MADDRTLKGGGGDPEESETNSNGVSAGKNYLLLIGINDYEDAGTFPKLHNCEQDGKDIKQILTTKYQFGADEVVELYGQDAKRGNIFGALSDLKAKSKKGEINTLMILFSGHGMVKDNKGYWIPYDAKNDEDWNWISSNYLMDVFKGFENMQYLLLFIDCCYSSKILKNDFVPQTYTETRYVFTSGRNEPVPDGDPGDNSPFIKALKLILDDNNQPLEIYRLFNDIKNKPFKYQRPLLSPLQTEDDPKEFFFTPKVYTDDAPDATSLKEAFFEMQINLLEGTKSDGRPIYVDCQWKFDNERPAQILPINLIALKGHPNEGHALVAHKLIRFINANNLNHCDIKFLSLGVKSGVNYLDVWDAIKELAYPNEPQTDTPKDNAQLAQNVADWLKEKDLALLIEITAESGAIAFYKKIEEFLNELADFLPPNNNGRLFIFVMDKREQLATQEAEIASKRADRAFSLVMPKISSFTPDSLVKWSGRFATDPKVFKPLFKQIPFNEFNSEQCRIENAVIAICDYCKLPKNADHPVSKIFFNRNFLTSSTATNET
ncbi:MAG: caspase family protein [Saprospiraceae bacterium]|nr:caspase family protein [Saprospiraceae bacterium]